MNYNTDIARLQTKAWQGLLENNLRVFLQHFLPPSLGRQLSIERQLRPHRAAIRQ
jgi:hypothetical protein